MSILRKMLKNLSTDRIKYLGVKAKGLAEDMDKTFNDLSMFEVFYTLSLAILSLLERLGNKSLGYFTEIFNEMTLIYQHKNN